MADKFGFPLRSVVPSNEKDKRVDEVDNPFENEDDSVILLKGLHGGNGKAKKSFLFIDD